MKSIWITFILLCNLSFVHGQRDLEIIKTKNEDRSVNISVVNYGTEAYDMTLTMVLDGMKMEDSTSTTCYIPADTTVVICKLLPTKEQTKFKITYHVESRNNATNEYSYESPNILFYSKNGQAASTELRNYLDRHEINYREYNVSYSPETKAKYEAMLERRSLQSKEVKLPVVIVKGEVFYNIKDMKQFIATKLVNEKS